MDFFLIPQLRPKPLTWLNQDLSWTFYYFKTEVVNPLFLVLSEISGFNSRMRNQIFLYEFKSYLNLTSISFEIFCLEIF